MSESLRRIPIVRYRLGICGSARADDLRAVRAADAEFVDADYVLGQYALQLRPYPDVDAAIRLFASAAAAFPASPAIATNLGDANSDIEEWTAAVRAYDLAIALVATHPEALRGRTIALSSLNDHPAAIETATRMLAGQDYLGDAYYWRAWNHYQLQNFDTARADGNRMKSLMANSRTFLLSGMIDWKLRRLESAEVEFEESLAIERGQCEAATFLGGVRNERGKSREALEAFRVAVQCYELTITLHRTAIKSFESSDAPEAFKTRAIARHQRGLAQAERRRDEAANGVSVLEKYLTSIEVPQGSRRQ